MKQSEQDRIIEKWMKETHSEYSHVRELEISEGKKFVNKLRKLIDIVDDEDCIEINFGKFFKKSEVKKLGKKNNSSC